jgi:SNF2 family DNA or RNA helicase
MPFRPPSLPPAHTHSPQGFQKLQLLLRAILLRRTKGTTIKGAPIINLPERKQELVRVPLTRAEADFYKQVC